MLTCHWNLLEQQLPSFHDAHNLGKLSPYAKLRDKEGLLSLYNNICHGKHIQADESGVNATKTSEI